MRAIVRSVFRKFNERFEGEISYMYADIKGLVTTGVGNLIDPVELALTLKWRKKVDALLKSGPIYATQDEIRTEWHRIKSDPTLAVKGARACAGITSLYLDDAEISRLIDARLAGNEAYLKRQPQFSRWEAWLADAQLAILSMAWAMGAADVMTFHHLLAACETQSWQLAAAACHMDDSHNPGLVPRNEANRKLFLAAATATNPELLSITV